MPDLPASHRLRIGRYAQTNGIYLLTTNTLGRVPVFKDFYLGRLIVDQFRTAQDQGWAHSLAWVVMPDHFHWLVELQQNSLGELMQKAVGCCLGLINNPVAAIASKLAPTGAPGVRLVVASPNS